MKTCFCSIKFLSKWLLCLFQMLLRELKNQKNTGLGFCLWWLLAKFMDTGGILSTTKFTKYAKRYFIKYWWNKLRGLFSKLQ